MPSMQIKVNMTKPFGNLVFVFVVFIIYVHFTLFVTFTQYIYSFDSFSPGCQQVSSR